MKIIIQILLVILLQIHITANAQEVLKVFGNVGVENVNIQIINTQYGTSSDKNGDYSLNVFKTDDNSILLYSCVGYSDTIVMITPDMFLSDSVEISFRMRHVDYDLPAAEITATRDFYRSRSGNAIVDISFYDDKILILENRKSKSELYILNDNGNEK